VVRLFRGHQVLLVTPAIIQHLALAQMRLLFMVAAQGQQAAAQAVRQGNYSQ
jgi:hypothetical protein